MFSLHEKRYGWEHDTTELVCMFTYFSISDDMPEPRCLLGMDWDIIKLDLIEIVGNIK